jgi:hypothetical protein
MALATVAHEFTHIWQYENLDFRKMKSDWGRLLTEGHAMWVEIDCLQRKGIGRKYREKEAVSRGICRSTRMVVAKLTP